MPMNGRFLVFAPETLDTFATSALKMLQFDNSWNPVSSKNIFDEDGTHASMATTVRLESGYMIVNLRIRTGVALRSAPPPLITTTGPLPDDSASLVRLVLAPDGTIISRETLVPSGVVGPHTALVGDLLITTWQGHGSAYLRIDRIQ